MRSVAVLGAGSWGTALAVHLARVGHDVRLYTNYPSRVAAELAERYGFGRGVAYRLIDAARRAVYEGLRADGRAADPLTAAYLFLESVMADGSVPMQHRIAAASAIIKLLGLHRPGVQLGYGDVDAVLTAIVARWQARLQDITEKVTPLGLGRRWPSS